MKLFLAATAALALALASCDPPPTTGLTALVADALTQAHDAGLGGDAGGSDASVDAEPLCAADGLLVRWHARLEACGVGDPDGIDDVAYQASCRGGILPYLADGTVALGDATALAACAAYVDGAPCSALSRVRLGPCAGVLVGQQPSGAACETDEQCAGGYCAAGPAGAACGTCAPVRADGEACERHGACASGRCADDGCAAPVGAGAACRDDGDCAGALSCRAGLCSADPAIALDAPCDVTLEACAPATTGRFCNATGASTRIGTCRPFAALGAACVALGARPGAWCNWTAGHRCSGGACVAAGLGAIGAACDPESPCASGLRCHGGLGTCVAAIHAGGLCDDPDVCRDGLTCVSGQCRPGPYTGACP